MGHIDFLSTVEHECFKGICAIELNPKLGAVEYALFTLDFVRQAHSNYSPRYAKLNISMGIFYRTAHYKNFIAFFEAVGRLDSREATVTFSLFPFLRVWLFVMDAFSTYKTAFPTLETLVPKQRDCRVPVNDVPRVV